ncbi:hypothetical protein V8D89_008927 [Ganoderma adspersum]
MSYPVNYVHLLSVSSTLWLSVGGTGKGIWYNSQPPAKVTKDAFVTLFKCPEPPIKIDSVTDTTPPPLPSPSHPTATPTRPTLIRACTSATLIDTDFLSDTLPPIVSPRVAEARRKPSSDSFKSTKLVDRLRNHLPSTPEPPVEAGNLDQDAQVVNVVAPPPKVRRAKKRTTRKKTVRWAAEVIEWELKANRPVTGHERLARFKALGYSV